MKKKIRLLAYLLTVLVFVVMLTNSCKKDEENTNTVADIDGNVYHTVTIGTQVWMVENLKVTKYRDGTSIPNVTDNTQWSNLTTGAYCNFNNTASNSTIYGKLYNWYAVNDSRNISPTGWHVSTPADWKKLTDYLGGESLAGGKLKETSLTHWNAPNTGATNESGFTALPGGHRVNIGEFLSIGVFGFWWSSDTSIVETININYNDNHVNRNLHNYDAGLSVRCIKDN